MNAAIKRTVNRMTETKVKWLVTQEHQLTTNTTCTVWDPMMVVRGDASDQRDGNIIRPVGMHGRGFFHNNGDKAQYLRIVIFKAKTQNNFANSIDVFDSANGDAQSPYDIDGARCIYYPLAKSKMHVLKDKVIKLGPKTQYSNGAHTKSFNFWVPLKGKIRYEANSC